MSGKTRTSPPVPSSIPVSRAPLNLPAMALPAPQTEQGMALHECLSKRRSSRNFEPASITQAECSQLLWALQGVTGLGGLRTAPSAGATYPLRAYLISAHVDQLPTGVHAYNPDTHELRLLAKGDKRRKLYAATLGQECTRECALAVLLAADYRRISRDFGERGVQLAHMEAGHAGQNFLLQCTALGLGAIGLGNFDASILREALPLPAAEEPVYLLLAGRV